MAILGNTVINGSLRCLNKIYAQDLAAAGTTSFANLAASGTLSVTGNTTLTTMTATGTVTLSKTQDLSGTANNSPALIVGGTASQGHLELDSNEIQAKTNATSVQNLTLNNDGGRVYLSNGGKIYAENGTFTSASINNSGTILTENINVINTLRATRYDLQSIASTGGALYVSPTVKFPNSGTTLVVAKSGTTLTLTITDSSITSTTMAGIVWSANSRVKVSGTINGVATGTMDGTVTSINTSSHVLTLSVSGENSGSVAAGTYSATQFSDLSVMIYQRRDGSNDYRVGIWLNCYDIVNNSASIRIYGGSSALPNVMLGNLTSAGLGTVNGMTPTGWGLFAQNAFLHGVIVASSGSIGGFELSSNAIKTQGVAVTENTDNSIALSSADFTRTVAGASRSGLRMAVGDKFGLTGDGVLYASNAVISGSITATSGYFGATDGTNGWTIGNGKIESTYTYSNATKYMGLGTYNHAWAFYSGATVSGGSDAIFRVGHNGEVYASNITVSGGKVGGFRIDATSIRTDNVAVTSNADNSISLSSADFTRTINGTSRAGLRFAIGDKLGITGDGAIYASSATITGEIYADTGRFGGSNGFVVATNKIYKTKTTLTDANDGVYIGTDGIALGANSAFKVTNAGALNATSGTIGGWTIGEYVLSRHYDSINGSGDTTVFLAEGGLVINVVNSEYLYSSYSTSYTNNGLEMERNGSGKSLQAAYGEYVSITSTQNNISRRIYLHPNSIQLFYNNNTTINMVPDTGTITATKVVPTNLNGTMQPNSWQSAQNLAFINLESAANSDNGSYYPWFRSYYTNNTDTYTIGYYAYDGTADILYSPHNVYASSNSYTARWTFGKDGSFSARNGLVKCASPHDNGMRSLIGSSLGTGYIVSAMYSDNNKLFITAQWARTATYSLNNITTTASDIRLKENVKDSTVNALTAINKMKLREFDWKSNGEHKSIGFIADELELIDPELVSGGGYNDQGFMVIKSIDHLELTAYLTKAIQEQQKQIESLKRELEEVRSQS